MFKTIKSDFNSSSMFAAGFVLGFKYGMNFVDAREEPGFPRDYPGNDEWIRGFNGGVYVRNNDGLLSEFVGEKSIHLQKAPESPTESSEEQEDSEVQSDEETPSTAPETASEES